MLSSKHCLGETSKEQKQSYSGPCTSGLLDTWTLDRMDIGLWTLDIWTSGLLDILLQILTLNKLLAIILTAAI